MLCLVIRNVKDNLPTLFKSSNSFVFAFPISLLLILQGVNQWETVSVSFEAVCYTLENTSHSQPFCLLTPTRRKSMLEVTPFQDSTLWWRCALINGGRKSLTFLQILWHACWGLTERQKHKHFNYTMSLFSPPLHFMLRWNSEVEKRYIILQNVSKVMWRVFFPPRNLLS